MTWWVLAEAPGRLPTCVYVITFTELGNNKASYDLGSPKQYRREDNEDKGSLSESDKELRRGVGSKNVEEIRGR